MPPKRGGDGGSHKRIESRDNQFMARQLTTTNGTQLIKNLSTFNTPNQSKFSIAPLILEGVPLNKRELNDMIKNHLTDVKVFDIQLSRSGIFTLYATDVKGPPPQE